MTHLKVSAEMTRGVTVAVTDFRDYLMERSIPNLVDKVTDGRCWVVGDDNQQVADLVILGVEEAIIERKRKERVHTGI